MKTARDLFEHELRDLYDAEMKLTRAVGRMAKKCSDPDLVSGLEEHQAVTETQARRLEQVFELIGRKPRREACAGINGLIEEFSKFLDEKPDTDVLDVFANGAAQKVERYEMCAYQSLIELADLLGVADAVELFQASLTEEQQAAETLKSMSARLGKKLEAEVVLPS